MEIESKQMKLDRLAIRMCRIAAPIVCASCTGVATAQFTSAGPGSGGGPTIGIETSEYTYDDGRTENAIGLEHGGTICWMHYYVASPGNETIRAVTTAFGSAAFPSGTLTSGEPAWIGVWEDLNDDGDPSDAVLLLAEPTTIENVYTDIPNRTVLSTPVTVRDGFFIGVWMQHEVGEYPAPLDESTNPMADRVWLVGDTQNRFDPRQLTNNDVPPTEIHSLNTVGHFLLRADSDIAAIALTVSGRCPGDITVTARGGTPFEKAAFLYSVVPGRTSANLICPGAFLDLHKAKLAAVQEVNSAGEASIRGFISAKYCNRLRFQAIDLAACVTSNVGMIP